MDSIFEAFKIGSGPSSSHSIGPQRAAQLFLRRLQGRAPARFRVTLFGSLAATGRGHLTDQTLLAALAPTPTEIVWDTAPRNLPHPNTLRLEAWDAAGTRLDDWTVCSVGGGDLRDEHGPVGLATPVRYPWPDLAAALDRCRREGLAFWQLVERHETDLWPRLDRLLAAQRESVERGLRAGAAPLPGTLGLRRRATATRERAAGLGCPERDLMLLAAFALAAAEENAAGGVVVTAPSCGATGVLAGLLYYFETVKATPREDLLRALATAGLLGSAIRANASVSGAEVGCQGEIGSACSMAAGAAAQLLGGTPDQIEYAAEIGMEHHLGLTCDPVEGYVQIPCIERNMTACLRAFECACFAALTDGRHLVSFDDVIKVMYQTGRDLQSAYRETARGGLALLWRRRSGAPPAGAATAAPAASQC